MGGARHITMPKLKLKHRGTITKLQSADTNTNMQINERKQRCRKKPTECSRALLVGLGLYLAEELINKRKF